MFINRIAPTALLLIFTAPLLVAQVPTAAPEECACEPPVPSILATVGSTSILLTDLKSQTASAIERHRQEVIEARKRELDLQINSKLLELESKKLGLTTKQLLEREVFAKIKQPSVADARTFYDQNSSRIGGTFDSVQKDIIDYLRSQNQQQAAEAYAARLRAAYAVKKLVEFAPAPTSPADRQKILATVGGQPIRSSDIEDSLKALIYTVQTLIYQQRKRDVDLQINDLLLQAEAKKRGITAGALLEREVTSKTAEVTEAEALAFFNENTSRINGTFATVKNQIIEYLREQKNEKARTAFADRLRLATPIKYFIAAPVSPVFNIPIENQPSKGLATAPVTIVEFVDFQCQRCRVLHPDILKLVDEFKGKVRLVMLDYPLEQHADARKAAEAAEAARAQGKYWEYVDVLLRNQSALGVAKLKEYARTIGLDGSRFDSELDSGKYAEKVDQDAALGARVGVGGTPTIFVNGRHVEDVTLVGIRNAVTSALTGH